MNLRKKDAGKVFVAPSGRRVGFIGEKSGAFLFRYLDDPSDGLALSAESLRILDKPADEEPRGTPCHSI
jgi:hypothetical protein